MATTLQKVKELSESKDLIELELEELKELKVDAQAVVDIVEILEGNEDEPLTLAGRLRKVPNAFSNMSPRLPDSTQDTYSGWLSPTGHATT